MFTRAAMLERREAEAKQKILDGWFTQLPGDRWRGTASEMAEELRIIADELGVDRWYSPTATGLTRWLDGLDVSGWTTSNGRDARGRWISFVRG